MKYLLFSPVALKVRALLFQKVVFVGGGTFDATIYLKYLSLHLTFNQELLLISNKSSKCQLYNTTLCARLFFSFWHMCNHVLRCASAARSNAVQWREEFRTRKSAVKQKQST